MIELLAPAGNMEKLNTALHFGADAVYLAGKSWGLRAFADNFDAEELRLASKKIHSLGKKMYVTVNIFAHNRDFDGLKEYLSLLCDVKADAVIVSDLGVMSFIAQHAPSLPIHVSTQANITNKYAVRELGKIASRVVLARELKLNEIREIKDFAPNVELEAFVHGAMCISYSGRCLLSTAMTGREGNRGECAQSCRWKYYLRESTRDELLPIEEDARGTYILNSKDLNMIEHIAELAEAGVTSFKIEGRAKSAYYAAGAVNAYRRAIDGYVKYGREYKTPASLVAELDKISHRKYCTGFYFGEPQQCLDTAKPEQPYDFIALAVGEKDGKILFEQRNRFRRGDVVEVLSAGEDDGKSVTIKGITDENGNAVDEAIIVQQRLFLDIDAKLSPYDMLRIKRQ